MDRASPADPIRGSGWSPPPMGFCIGILITGANSYGGVYKLRISIRKQLKDFYKILADFSSIFFLLFFPGLRSQIDGVLHRDSHYRRKFIGEVPKIQISTRELLEDFIRKSSVNI